jgi:hypothetical protein
MAGLNETPGLHDAPVRIVSYGQLIELGFRRRKAPVTLLVLDPSGEGDDRNGFGIIERHELELGLPHDKQYQMEQMFVVRHVERLDRGMEFPDVISLILAYHKGLLKLPKRIARHWIVVETNGVGYGYASMLKKLCGSEYVIPIVTTGSPDDRAVTDDNQPRMPRMAGLDLLRMMLQLQRAMVLPNVKGADLLVSELRTFVYHGRKPQAMDGAHDDLVMMFALGVWAGVKLIPPVSRADPAPNIKAAMTPLRVRLN